MQALSTKPIKGISMMKSTANTEDEHHDAHGAHNEHEGIGHALGTAVGVIAGLLLFVGHLLNLRVTRRREECCD